MQARHRSAITSGIRATGLTTSYVVRRSKAIVIALSFSVLAPVITPVRAQVAPVAIATPSLLPVSFWGHPTRDVTAVANVLTIRINSGAAQTIASVVDNSINAFPNPVSVTTEWALSSLTFIDLVAYFPSATAALVSGPDAIPSSRITGRMTTGRVTSFTAFTQNGVGGLGTAGASLYLFRQLIIAGLNGTGQRTDNLDLQLDLRGAPTLPGGTYRGTLALRAIAY